MGRKLQENDSRVRDLETRLAEALQRLAESQEQQMATAEILRVISSLPTNLQPVLDAIAANAVRVCGAYDATVLLREGELVRRVAHHGPLTSSRQDLVLLDQGFVSNRSIIDSKPVHLHNVLTTEGPDFAESRESARRSGFRTILSVPLLHEGRAIGALNIRRQEIRPFSDSQIALLQTFADQAVIAIENVRLLTELQQKNHALTESLEQQTATSEILRVISSSPTDTQPVFDAIAESAARLCGAIDAQVLRVEGEALRLVAACGATAMPSVRRLTRGHLVGRAVIDRRTIHVRDLAQALAEYPETTAGRYGIQSALAVPLVREGVALGVIRVSRTEFRPFTDEQIALLQTFADQAVIAIENVRLFTELQEKNRALTEAHAQVSEALAQQTATADILRAISSSPIDARPVFSAIAESAARLTGAVVATVYEFDGSLVHLRVIEPSDYPHGDYFRRNFPRPPAPDFAAGRVMLGREVLHLADLQNDPDTPELTRDWARRMDLRSVLWVPMLREGEPIGVIGAVRSEAGFFADDEVRLLQTFADQAVIAIENVRLFTELKARTQQLTRSVDQLTALGEVGQAITSTLDLQTVLSTIVARATQLTGVDAGVIYEYDEAREVFEPRATERLEQDIVKTLEATPVRKGQGATGRLAEAREPIQVSDLLLDIAAQISARDALVRAGYRAVLAVPLIREDHLIGGLTVFRRTPGEFASGTVDLLRTFATQSALAIQNARLFQEIADKSRQLEIASQHKSEFLANMSHELRTPLNAIIGFSEVLTDRMFGELNEKQDEYLKDIHASGTHLLSLINDILDLSKIEAGRMELEVTDFDLPTAIDNALMLVRERAGRRGITLWTAVDSRVGQVQADERKVRQVVLNLLSNAVKFTPEGGRIEVGAVPRDGAVEVSISDTGVGIAPEDQEAVFEEFRQVGTAAKKVEGTGLGLALCRKFVELHGGRIWVKSQVGVGSTFTFSLPLRSA